MGELVPAYAFTSFSKGGILGQLKNQVNIEYEDNNVDVLALWDTGASGTCISTEVVHKLGLIPTGQKNIQTPSGTSQVNTYLVNINLPNNVHVKDVVVCDSEIGNQGIGVLIGMDIITLGDFAVSNYNNSTVFTFRMPSQGKTDYVHELNMKKMIGTHGKGKRKKK